MCGICGEVNFRAKIDEMLVRGMTDLLIHRGPDEEGFYFEDGVGLGVRRLAIIDIEGGSQPITNEDESVVVVFNGEIYNFLALRDALIKRGHSFRTKCDTEVIVHLYEEYGERCVEFMEGMFAFIIWDKRKKALFAARDRVGIKPFYYWRKGARFIFASELKPLMLCPEVGRKISQDWLRHYIMLPFSHPYEGAIEGVKKLPPGHFLVFNKEGLEVEKYWELEKGEARSWEDELEESIKEAVKAQLVSDVPRGVFLSGGIDSSIITWAAREAGPIKTISVGFEEKGFSELAYAAFVAKTLGTEHVEMRIGWNEAYSALFKVLGRIDEPLADSSLLPTFMLSQLARGEVKVALAGDGGDELFGGYPRYVGAGFLKKFDRLPDVLKRFLQFLINRVGWEGRGRADFVRYFRRFMRRSEDVVEQYILWLTQAREDVINDFKKFCQVVVPDIDMGDDLIEAFMMLDFKNYLPEDLLRKVDRASMLNSLEVRVPLLSERVIRVASSIPVEYKVQGGHTKLPLRKILAKYLPGSIVRRRKQGFAMPVGKWFAGELGDIAQEMFSGVEIPLIGKDRILAILGEHRGGRRNFGEFLWGLLALAVWVEENEIYG